MVDYVSLAATAQRLITKNGRDVSLTKNDRTPADPAKPWRGGGTGPTTIGPFKGVVIPFESEDTDGTLVRRAGRRAFIAANDTSPELIEEYDTLVDGTEVWRILEVETINPGDVRVLYELQLRR